MQSVLIIAITVIAVVVAALALGIFRIGVKKPDALDDQGEKYFTYGDGDEDTEGSPQAEGDEEQEELVNLVDYYADYEDEKRDDTPTPKRSEAQEAMFDKLCNLKVGRGYLLDCQNFLIQASQSGQRYAMAYFDFSRFRFINTLKGFSTGDYVLTRISQEAQQIFPKEALMTRLAADHFTVLFPYVDEDQLTEMFDLLRRAADRIRQDIGAKHGMQICMGVSLATTTSDYDVFKMLRRANIARHCNKIAKEESFSFFDDNMITSYLFGESSVEDYKELQYSDDFSLYLSPQLSISTKRVAGCAAQARWPYEEISDNPLSVEKGGILTSNNFKVAYHMCRAMSRWRKLDSITLPAMVALSEIDIIMDDVDAFFARCLGEFQLDAGLLTVVISQHVIRLHPEIVMGQIAKLKNIGLKIAISDFDRGTQNLEVLGDFKPDCIKLHKSFAGNVEKLPERQEDVARILGLAAELGCTTVFEGVDSSSGMAYFSTTNATLVEGRYVGLPITVDEFAKEMKSLVRAAYDPNTTVIMDDLSLGKGNFTLY